MMSQPRYFAAGSALDGERDRLSTLERLFDDVTRDALTRLGVREGWRCCEIGAGGGSMTRWLAQVIGPKGRVVAVDLDTRFLADIDQANVEVIKADFLSDARIGDAFDLVFTRFVLLHLSDPARAVRRMAELVKPNGWVFAIDCDLCNVSAADPGHRNASLFDQVRQKEQVYDRDHYGINCRMGRSLSKLFEDAGLVDVDNSAWTTVARGGSLQAEFWYRTWELAGPRMMAAGVLSREEHETDLSTLTDPTFRFLDALYFRASGRKPSM
jgi:2-polyprenyl-3-methyl-5-hydroxy-6-metoxy-1,4-benzoquinol methylase